jgi:EAL domain-containing protein (putative c-di-GMP-specific phosphodiesterase class I)
MIFKKGEILMHQDALEGSAYIIESGTVEILLEKEGQLLQISTRGPGSIVGEMAMIDDRPRTATVRALDECHVIEVTRDDFLRHVESADPIIKMVMRVIVTRYRDMVARIEGIHRPAHFPSAQEVENTDKFRDVALNAIKVHTELKEALNKNELLLFYQPIIDLQKMKIAGFEALMRWKHPEKGMISPGVFIPVAEESGLIVDLSKWALDQSCDAVKALQQAADPKLTTGKPLFVSVNFSVKDFSDSDFFTHLDTTLTNKGTRSDQIHLEITESLLMEAPGAARSALEKCRAHGISVSIDDFGTGYSSLSYLHSFPIDTLKIDQSFVRSMLKHASSLALVKSIIGLARNLNMTVIAEGIETEDEAKLIRDLGCEQCQGFWFAKPLPFDDALAFVKNWKSPL